jgi:hypothetical protein
MDNKYSYHLPGYSKKLMKFTVILIELKRKDFAPNQEISPLLRRELSKQ